MRGCIGWMWLMVVGCGGGQQIDDPAMQQTGALVGQQTGDIAALEADADEATVQASAQALGGSLQSLVGQHQAMVGGAAGVPARRADRQARSASADEPVVYDGSELCIDLTYDQAGVAVVYQVELTFSDAGDGVVVDGFYDLDYAVGALGVAVDYAVSAQFDNVTTDATGCAVSGSVEVVWDAQVSGVAGAGATDQSGVVTVTYNGCDDVVITGR